MENDIDITNIPEPKKEQLFNQNALDWTALTGMGGGLVTIGIVDLIGKVIPSASEPSHIMIGGIGLLLYFGAGYMAKNEMKKTEAPEKIEVPETEC